MFKDPFDPNALLGRRCGCGGDHSESEHGRLAAEAVPAGEEARWNRVVDAAVLRAVFPVDAQRRLFLKTVGAATAMAAISSVLPLAPPARPSPRAARRRRRTSRWASSPSPAPRPSSWPIRWASMPSTGSTSKW